ncbi:MAG: DUF3035 domain-containing protein [Pseudomonadota bacterium]|nr:DUF3035 domain-containing protein [Pseudomonadota bacterium]
MKNQSMKKSVPFILLNIIFSVLVLGGCEKTKEAVGLTKQPPDEFSVVTRAPLVLPPDYGLRPPKPGVKRPQEVLPIQRARVTLFRKSDKLKKVIKATKISRGEASLLINAGAENSDSKIRQLLNKENSGLVEADKKLLKKIIFWKTPPKPGKLVDPINESKRLKEALALGEKIKTKEVPVIVRKEKGFFEELFPKKIFN